MLSNVVRTFNDPVAHRHQLAAWLLVGCVSRLKLRSGCLAPRGASATLLEPAFLHRREFSARKSCLGLLSITLVVHRCHCWEFLAEHKPA
jgi:hypothetical protein